MLTRKLGLGCTEAQYFMGMAFDAGDGVPKNMALSLAWYRKAAAKNHPSALYDLALHYLEEKTNRASMELADKYMLRAARAGHREAQFQCAMTCFRGNTMPQDCEAGKNWLAKSAAEGWAKAEFTLYEMYFNGRLPAQGCSRYPQDRPEAVRWLRRAVEHDHLQAQTILAIMLIRGKDIPPDQTEAERLLRHAAGHGNSEAQNDLGYAILSGATAKRDLVEAAMWCKLAQNHAFDSNILMHAQVNYTNVTSHLSLKQQMEAEQWVRAFQAQSKSQADPRANGWEHNPEYECEDGQLGR